MEERDQLPDLRTLPGGVACQNASSRALGEGHSAGDEDLEFVEDALNGPDGSPTSRREFQKAPWKNYFLVDCYRYPSLDIPFGHGTAFLIDLVRFKNGEEYMTFLTAGHVLFRCARIVLRHSSDLLKGGDPVSVAKDIVDLRKSGNKKNGWFEFPRQFESLRKDTNGPRDYGAIFVKKEYLKNLMGDYDIALDHDLFTVRMSNLQSLPQDGSVSVFMAGYPPKEKVDNGDFTYLAKSGGKYRRRNPSGPHDFILRIQSNSRVKLPQVDGHTADAREGMSGSPIVLGEFPRDGAPSTAHLKVIAIHLGGVRVDDEIYAWASDAPADFKDGKGLNFARPLTQDVLDDLHLVQPGSQLQPVDEPDTGLPTAPGENVAGPENVTTAPALRERDERDAGLPTAPGGDVTRPANVTTAPAQRQRAQTYVVSPSREQHREVQYSGGSMDSGLLSGKDAGEVGDGVRDMDSRGRVLNENDPELFEIAMKLAFDTYEMRRFAANLLDNSGSRMRSEAFLAGLDPHICTTVPSKLHAVFEHWIKTAPGPSYERYGRQLRDVIRRMDRGRVAHEFKKYLGC